MFNSLLGEVSIDSLILDIFIILAVVVACALVVYFLWEAISALVKKEKTTGVKEPDLNEKVSKKEKEKEKEDVVFVDYSLDAKEDVNEAAVASQSLIDESKMTDVDEAKADEEKAEALAQVSDEERANAERRAYLEARRQELIRRMQAEMEEEDGEDEESAEETSEQESEQVDEKEDEKEAETVEEETSEEVEAVEPETVEAEVEQEAETAEAEQEAEDKADELEEERKALEAEKERYETMVKELELAKKALAEQKVETIQKIETIQVPTNGVLSLDELKARLAEAEEKLASTNKEFKQCKKEFIPLHKVWKAHDKDEKKLRRKEALVAKQKVILYGVNNYADIDEEKAKKLAEDLDLLDGLKLSVQHCEEVMAKNADRYPLLEKMYGVLKARNEEIKNDIAYYKAEIAKLEAEQNENNESEEN